MNARNLVGWFAAALLLGPQPAAAQEECPVVQIGLSCDAGVAGTCLAATCTETADGSTTTRSCGACVDLPANACSNPGQPCGDGGTCSPSGGGGGGGSANGSYSFMIGYSQGICEPPAPTGAEGDAATRGVPMGASVGSVDAAAALSGGDTTDAASSHSTSGSASGSGCALSDRAPDGGANALEGIAVLGATVMCRRRRRKDAR